MPRLVLVFAGGGGGGGGGRCHCFSYAGSYFSFYNEMTLGKHAYSNILKISPPKTEDFQMKNSDIFHISAQNIDCGYSLEPPR